MRLALAGLAGAIAALVYAALFEPAAEPNPKTGAAVVVRLR